MSFGGSRKESQSVLDRNGCRQTTPACGSQWNKALVSQLQVGVYVQGHKDLHLSLLLPGSSLLCTQVFSVTRCPPAAVSSAGTQLEVLEPTRAAGTSEVGAVVKTVVSPARSHLPAVPGEVSGEQGTEPSSVTFQSKWHSHPPSISKHFPDDPP